MTLDELLAGVTSREVLAHPDGKSGVLFERVVIDGERFVVKHLHVDDDWIMRATGDVRCRPLVVWSSGLLDRLPASIDHAIVGVAEGLGRNGWGAAVLMRDVAPWLVPEGDEVAVHLITQSDPETCVRQTENLNQMANAFAGSRVAFSWELDHSPNFHARSIITDTAWKITIDRAWTYSKGSRVALSLWNRPSRKLD